ncbi:tyrosine-type recombinase/integrase [Lichenicoccus sp.]|uniref:tyrosine-type recombinase/integrase n=1 Tax=Lichenicoccus sp. TaxID=2781899 RepID=UPI003D11865E
MPKKAAGLTAAKVSKAAAGRYVDGNGLRLLVRETGVRFWIFRYTLAGRTREMGLGRAGSEPGAVPLSEARQTAGELHRLVRSGVDPLARRVDERAAAKALAQQTAIRGVTFEQAAERFMLANRAGWKNAKHSAQWTSTLKTYAYPHLGDLPVADVLTEHVLAVLTPIWTSKAETATRVRGRIETVLDFAKTTGLRAGDNPARWRGHLSNALPARADVAPVEHHAALPWNEIGGFMVDLAQQPGVGALALRFAILTAARSSEVLGARWSEIDVDAALWTVPATRMKAKKEHRVPLAPAALALLADAARLRLTDGPNAFVFPGAVPGKGMSNMAMTMVLRRMKRGDATTHGFRSSFRDWCSEATSYPGDIAEAALAHVVENKVEAAYRRGDLFAKRRDLMTTWADFCGQPQARPAVKLVTRTG